MKVILNQDFEKLGKKGEIIEVKDGYARNFLLTQDIAVVATDKNIQKAEKWKKQQAKAITEEIKEAEKLKEKLDKTIITIKTKVKNDKGELFGSIGSAEISEELKKQGLEVEKSQIDLSQAIKKLGKHQVTLKLPHDLSSSIQITLEKE